MILTCFPQANLGTIACTVYSTLYMLMEPVAGGMLAPLLLGGTAYANHLTSTYGAKANYIALGIHLFSWIAQFIGTYPYNLDCGAVSHVHQATASSKAEHQLSSTTSSKRFFSLRSSSGSRSSSLSGIGPNSKRGWTQAWHRRSKSSRRRRQRKGPMARSKPMVTRTEVRSEALHGGRMYVLVC